MKKFEKLQKLQKNAYCPYSSFRVAAIAVVDGQEFVGVNVENLAYGSTICAERNAIFSAIAHGYQSIEEMHLLTDSYDPSEGTPCGSCRQVMSEFLLPDSIIYVYGQNGKCKEFKIKELLPHSFAM